MPVAGRAYRSYCYKPNGYSEIDKPKTAADPSGTVINIEHSEESEAKKRMNANELGISVGTERKPHEVPFLARGKYLLRYDPVGTYMILGKSKDATICPYLPPHQTEIKLFGGDLDRKVAIMARNATKHVAELDENEINVVAGGLHVGAATRVGRSRVKIRMDYSTRIKPKSARGVHWFIDAGCAHDLAQRSHVVRLGLKGDIDHSNLGLTLNRPGWYPKVQRKCCYGHPRTKSESSLIVLEPTPDVLSMSRRCVLEGYRFVWGSFVEKPYFVAPSRNKVKLPLMTK